MVLMFGEDINKDSDIDLVVISDDFKDMDTWERLMLLGSVRIGIKNLWK